MSARVLLRLALTRVLLPIGVTLCVTSALHAQTVTLQWDANTEPNLAGYVVVYGTQPGVYTTSMDVGNVTTVTVRELLPDTTYYFAVKAYNNAFLVSTPSTQVSVTTPPASVGSLQITSVTPSTGPKSGGTAIVVRGTGFQSGARVSIGSIAAAGVTFVSATELRATTAAGPAGSQTVTVTNPSSQQASMSGGFTFTGRTPKLLTLSPGSGPIFGGTELRLTGADLSSDVSVRIGTQPAYRIEYVSDTELRVWTPARLIPGPVDVALMEGGQVQSTLAAAFRYVLFTSTEDTDGDGMPSVWEVQWGLDATSANGDNGPAGDPDNDGRTNIEEFRLGSHPHGVVKRYFAEGVVNSFFDTRLALANPGTVEARVLLEFQDLEGQRVEHEMRLRPRSRATLDVRSLPGMLGRQFSTRIESDQVIVADRLMQWEASLYGSHAETAVAEPSSVWYFAEGATHGPHELFFLLQNPTDDPTTAQIRYIRRGGLDPVMRTYDLTPHSRTTVYVDMLGRDLDEHDISAEITTTNGVPIIAERSQYYSYKMPLWGGHGSAGVTAASKEWFLAEGGTGSFFTMFVLMANPTNEDADVKVTYLLSDGSPIEHTYRVVANSRYTLCVNTEPGLSNAIFASRYESTVPIIVERTMFWPFESERWQESHNSFGVTSTGTKWALAEGEFSGSPQSTMTYVLVANTSAFNGNVKVTLLFEDGTEVSKNIALPASSRLTVPFDGPLAAAAGKRFATIVESIGTTPAQIVVERAMYSNARGQFWGSGSNAVATKLQ